MPSYFAMDGSEMIKKRLFRSSMEGRWNEVVKLYKENPEVHTAKVTKSGDTALHIAVSDAQEDVVEELVSALRSSEALKVGNERDNTPLHLAASLGSVRMCHCIAEKGSAALIGARNVDSETPLFLAALHGNKEAFLCLHSFLAPNEGYSYCRRSDGDTILHCAIAGEYFDLAFQIIHLYQNLVNSVNEQGLSPLHLFAAKPSVFKSGIHLRRFYKIIYHCTFVDELVEESLQSRPDQQTHYKGSRKEEINPKYPKNYQTCVQFFQLPTKFFGMQVTGMFKHKNLLPVIGICEEKNEQLRNLQVTGNSEVNSNVKKLNNQSVAENSKENDDKKLHNQSVTKNSKESDDKKLKNQSGDSSSQRLQVHQMFPSNYSTCFEMIKLICKAILVVLGLGSREIMKIRAKKEKHLWSVQIVNELLKGSSTYEYEDNGQRPQHLLSEKDLEAPPDLSSYELPADLISAQAQQPTLPAQNSIKPNQTQDLDTKNGKVGNEGEKNKAAPIGKKETPILVAAKHGVIEMVEEILRRYPVAIHDLNSEKKNIVLLAVENRQPHIYEFLLKQKMMKDNVFRRVDNDGNSALHLAAMLRKNRPWLIPGAALQMQWEIKWYEFVKDSMPLHFFVRYNKTGQTARDIFTDTHSELVRSGGEWLTHTSESCSVVAALIATVAFATSATVPGGVREGKGTPTLENEPAFNIFAISSLVALCFSVTSVIMFLAILTSRYQEKDFGRELPRRLLVGLTSLFVSIATMLVSFCAGHFFVLKDQLKYAAFPVYAITCLPITFFVVVQFPLYFDLIWATFKKVPQRT